jgi:hypothetical protein
VGQAAAAAADDDDEAQSHGKGIIVMLGTLNKAWWADIDL